jgi:RNA-directed DNA polymerase
MDKVILKAFLKAGFVFNSVKHETPQGVPQGSPISPIISNMVLDGLQAIVTRAGSFFKISKFRETLLMVRYADDFMIVGLTAKLE